MVRSPVAFSCCPAIDDYQLSLNAYSTVPSMVQSTVGLLRGSFSKDGEKSKHSPLLGMCFRLRHFHYDVEQDLRKRGIENTLLDPAHQIAELL